MSWSCKLERVLMIVGVMLLAVYMASLVHRTVLSKAELQRFKARQSASAGYFSRAALTSENPDFGSWSSQRIRDYQESLAEHFAPAIAVLRIPKIHLEVPVLEGTDDLTLNRGVGHVTGTANPGENGNMAIAGHRDGFFRGLKDIVLGDTIEVAAPDQTEMYVIDQITIVDPSDVSVLKPRLHESLTLVTCYPFYFIGSAPKRYIVQASIAEPGPLNRAASASQQSESGGVEQQASTR